MVTHKIRLKRKAPGAGTREIPALANDEKHPSRKKKRDRWVRKDRSPIYRHTKVTLTRCGLKQRTGTIGKREGAGNTGTNRRNSQSSRPPKPNSVLFLPLSQP
jgi:hypothetical protein